METMDELWNDDELENELQEEYQEEAELEIEESEEEIEAEEEYLELDNDENFGIVARGRPTGDRPED